MDFFEKHKNGVFFLTAVSAGSSVLAMLANYLYNIFMARSIPLGEYGRLSIAIAIITVLSIPGGSFSTFFTREFSKLQGAPEKIAFLAKKYSKKLFLGFSALTLAILAYFLNAQSPEAALAVLVIPAGYAALPFFSMLQAREDITILSGLNLLASILKLAIGVGLVSLGLGLMGAAAALAIPSVLILALAFFIVRKRLEAEKACKVDIFKPVALIVAVMLLQGLFLYADLFAVQYFFGNEQTGIYNVAETTAKITFFLSAAIIIAFFPKAAKLDFSKTREVAKLFATTSFFLVPPTLFFLLFPSQLISFFYGAKFSQAAHPFFLLAMGFFIYSLVNLAQSALLSKNREKDVLALNAFGIAVHAALLSALVPSRGMEGAAIAVIVSSAVLLAATLFALFRLLKRGVGMGANG